MSAFGQHVAFFRQDTGPNGSMMPPPIDWWSCDLLTQEGQESFMEIMQQVGNLELLD
jgi:hypothetical protein